MSTSKQSTGGHSDDSSDEDVRRMMVTASARKQNLSFVVTQVSSKVDDKLDIPTNAVKAKDTHQPSDMREIKVLYSYFTIFIQIQSYFLFHQHNFPSPASLAVNQPNTSTYKRGAKTGQSTIEDSTHQAISSKTKSIPQESIHKLQPTTPHNKIQSTFKSGTDLSSSDESIEDISSSEEESVKLPSNKKPRTSPVPKSNSNKSSAKTETSRSNSNHSTSDTNSKARRKWTPEEENA